MLKNQPTMDPIVNQTDIDTLIKVHDIFATINAKYGSPPNWNRPQGFITLCKIILEQQVSLQSANAHFNKLNTYLPDFIPEEILKLSDDQMRVCQISRQKSRYLKELSMAILDRKLELEKLPGLTQSEVRTKLKEIKGIGDWTADIYLMFCLQAKDIFPAGDIAVVNTIMELTTAKSKDEILECAEKWKPLRSLATFFLWHYYLSKRGRY
jgi:DNA-3-methyladenine glycosylase II